MEVPMAMMADPSTWPLRCVLPLVRGDDPFDDRNVGFLVAGMGPIVFHGNVLDLVPSEPLGAQLKRFKTTEHETMSAIESAGWRVD
jgi:hypothetical protein